MPIVVSESSDCKDSYILYRRVRENGRRIIAHSLSMSFLPRECVCECVCNDENIAHIWNSIHFFTKLPSAAAYRSPPDKSARHNRVLHMVPDRELETGSRS